jgi:hypothetical protein
MFDAAKIYRISFAWFFKAEKFYSQIEVKQIHRRDFLPFWMTTPLYEGPTFWPERL